MASVKVLPVALRASQKSVKALGGGFFTGVLSAVLLPVDIGSKLTFQANVKVNGGSANEAIYTPCDDSGKIKTFSNVDDLVNWLKGAYDDIITLTLEIANADYISKVFIPPTDAVADATKQKAKYVKLNTGLDDNLAAANAAVSSAALAGWNDPLSPAYHPALQANYNELVAKRDAIIAARAYYIDRIAFYQAIITPVI
jgi:hypothetical protein